MVQTNKYLILLTKEGSTKIVNSIIAGIGVLVRGRGHKSYSENAKSLFKAYIKQTEGIVMMTKRVGILVLGRGHESHTTKCIISRKI